MSEQLQNIISFAIDCIPVAIIAIPFYIIQSRDKRDQIERANRALYLEYRSVYFEEYEKEMRRDDA